MAAIWECRDNDHWLPYSAKVSQFLENAQTKKLTLVQLGDIQPELSEYSINLTKLEEKSKQQGHVDVTRPIRRTVCQYNFATQGVCWQWSDINAETWHFYELEVQNYIESLYQSDNNLELNLQEKFSHLPFIINFKTKTQTSKTDNRVRYIRRTEDNVYPKVRTRITRSSSSSFTETSQSLRKPRAKRINSKSSEQTSSPNQFSSMSFPGTSGASNKHHLKLSPEKSKKKKSNPDGSEANSFIKTITSSARVLVNLLTPNKSKGKSKIKISNPKSAMGAYVPFPILSDINCETPVPGVKLPSEIKMVNINDRMPVENMLQTYTKIVPVTEKDEDCCICCCTLNDPSFFGDGSDHVIELKSCSHKFHRECITSMYNSNNQVGYLQCPTCKFIYGIKVGNQPRGTMKYFVVPVSVPGYPDCGTIMIHYTISAGIQGPEHPFPGCQYTARGFPRCCYLPDNEEGRKVLKLLVTAWERSLIFTIGQSSTTGEESTVTWNEIHHKTEFGSNFTGHGYPDPSYIHNVLQELAIHGVTEDSLE